MKRLFVRESEPAPPSRGKLEERARKLDGNALLDWAEAALYPIGRGLSDYRKGLNPDGALEALQGAEALYVVLRELSQR